MNKPPVVSVGVRPCSLARAQCGRFSQAFVRAFKRNFSCSIPGHDCFAWFGLKAGCVDPGLVRI